MGSSEATNPLQTTQTSVAILQCVAESGTATLTELNDRVAVSKGALYNHLSTLVDLDLLERVDDAYRINLRVLELGEAARQTIPELNTMRQNLHDLAMTSGEFAALIVANNDTAIVAETAAGELVEQHWLSVGQELPLYSTAAGKIVLSELPEERSKELAMKQSTHDPEELLEEIRTIRVQGLAFSRGEYQESQYSVAAPIDSGDDSLSYVISLSGPEERLHGKSLQQDFAGLVVSTSTDIRRDILS